MFPSVSIADVTPVTGGAAAGKQNGFVFLLGFLESFLAPWDQSMGL